MQNILPDKTGFTQSFLSSFKIYIMYICTCLDVMYSVVLLQQLSEKCEQLSHELEQQASAYQVRSHYTSIQ